MERLENLKEKRKERQAHDRAVKKKVNKIGRKEKEERLQRGKEEIERGVKWRCAAKRKERWKLQRRIKRS